MYAAKNLLSCECFSWKGYLVTTNAGMTYAIRLRSSKFYSQPFPALATHELLILIFWKVQQKWICILEEGYASSLAYNTDSFRGFNFLFFFLIKMVTDCALTVSTFLYIIKQLLNFTNYWHWVSLICTRCIGLLGVFHIQKRWDSADSELQRVSWEMEVIWP